MVGLVKASVCIREDLIERRRQEDERERERQYQEMLRPQRIEEENRVKHLDHLLSNWVKAEHLRSFLKASEQSPVNPSYSGMEKRDWLNWAYRYADKLDPLTGEKTCALEPDLP